MAHPYRLYESVFTIHIIPGNEILRSILFPLTYYLAYRLYPTSHGSVTGRIVHLTAVVNIDVVSVVSRRTVVDQLTRVSVTTAVLAVTDALKQ